jgi:hypothetical protein
MLTEREWTIFWNGIMAASAIVDDGQDGPIVRFAKRIRNLTDIEVNRDILDEIQSDLLKLGLYS